MCGNGAGDSMSSSVKGSYGNNTYVGGAIVKMSWSRIPCSPDDPGKTAHPVKKRGSAKLRSSRHPRRMRPGQVEPAGSGAQHSANTPPSPVLWSTPMTVLSSAGGSV